MSSLNRYLFRNATASIAALVLLSIIVLLLERLLRIFEIVTSSTQPALDAGAMLLNLLPHFLGVALPLALLLGIIITIDRFSRSSELVAAYGAGISLFAIAKPFVLIAVIMSSMTFFVEGYMQPLGRYNYREVVHDVKQQSFAAILREGTFTQVGDRMFFAGTERPGDEIGPIFIYERQSSNNALRVTTAEQGQLSFRENGDPVLQLAEGRSHRIVNNARLRGEIAFNSSAIAAASNYQDFRLRGEDERELTSTELLQNREGQKFTSVTALETNAALHMRAARIVLMLILPFIGIAFGLNYGRKPSLTGLFIGVVLVVSVQKALELAQTLGSQGVLPSYIGIWSVIGLLAAFAFYVFRKGALNMGEPPLSRVGHAIDKLQELAKLGLINAQKNLKGAD